MVIPGSFVPRFLVTALPFLLRVRAAGDALPDAALFTHFGAAIRSRCLAVGCPVAAGTFGILGE